MFRSCSGHGQMMISFGIFGHVHSRPVGASALYPFFLYCTNRLPLYMDPFPISQSELNASDVLFGRGSNSTTLVINGKLVKKNEKFNRVISIFAVSSSNLLYIICIRLLFSYFIHNVIDSIHINVHSKSTKR